MLKLLSSIEIHKHNIRMKNWEKILVLALPLSQILLVILVVSTKSDVFIYLSPVVAALAVGYYTVLIRDILRRFRKSNEKAGWIVAMLFFWPAGLIYFFMFCAKTQHTKQEETL